MIKEFKKGLRYFFKVKEMKNTGAFTNSFLDGKVDWFVTQAEVEGFEISAIEKNDCIRVHYLYRLVSGEVLRNSALEFIPKRLYKYIYTEGENRFKQEEFEV